MLIKNNFYKICIFLLKHFAISVLKVFILDYLTLPLFGLNYFEFNGNVRSDYIYFRIEFSIFYFFFLLLSTFSLILIFIFCGNSRLLSRFFILLGFLINSAFYALIITCIGAFYFDAHTIYSIFEAGLLGVLSSLFLRPLLFPPKLVNSTL
ncbi:MAG: hypothetical protein EBX50_08020 [Chitinophagia bacterium]|nr:hypothetical protein [Chitinophagia bacterium]